MNKGTLRKQVKALMKKGANREIIIKSIQMVLPDTNTSLIEKLHQEELNKEPKPVNKKEIVTEVRTLVEDNISLDDIHWGYKKKLDVQYTEDVRNFIDKTHSNMTKKQVDNREAILDIGKGVDALIKKMVEVKVANGVLTHRQASILASLKQIKKRCTYHG